MPVEYRDLAAFGRPARLVWAKRRWRCEEPVCAARTWTESSPWFSSRCLLTNRAGRECCLQVGLNARPVAQMARELGVCWDTVMAAVREHGEPLLDDPARVGAVAQLGVDETTFLSANRDHPTLFATGLVDLKRRVVIDVIEGNSASDLGAWLDRQPTDWIGQIAVVATDLAESYRAGLSGRPRSRAPGRRPVPGGARGQPLPGSGPPPGPERDPRPPRSQARSALADPQADAHGHRAPGGPRARADAPRDARR